MKKNNILKKKLETVLDKPGVYKMLDDKGNILYIGKSITLKKRIASYFVKEINRNDKVKHMVKHINDVEVYYTDTELDALLLECLWIRAYKPPYNTALMHPEKYSYFNISQGENHSLSWVNYKDSKADLILGPITHKSIARGAYAYFRNRYMYVFCNKKIDGCLDYLTGKCKGYCKDLNYPSLVEDIIRDLEKIDIVEEMLTRHMEKLSERWEFEKAKEVYDQIRGIKYISRLYQMIRSIQEEVYIGKMPIPNTFYYKYYLVKGGKIIATRKGVCTEERVILKTLRRIARAKDKESVELSKDEIDQIKIIYSFKNKKMQVFTV